MNSATTAVATKLIPGSSALSRTSSVLLCATIVSTVLFSGIPGGNTVNFAVTAVFVSIAVGTAILERRPFKFYPEIIILIVWLCYSILPSVAAVSLDLAAERAQQMLQIIILALVAMNVMAWNGKIEVYLFFYFLAGIAAYLASIAGFGFGIIDQAVLQEMNSTDRVVGTHSNANQFGTLMVQALLAALLFTVQSRNFYARVLAVLACALFCIAVLHSGSRTALVGMVIVIAGLIWVFRVWRLKYMLVAVLLLAGLGVVISGSYLLVKDNEAVSTRIDSFVGNEQLMGRYDNLLRLITNFGDVDTIDNSIEGSASDRAQLANDAWEVAKKKPIGLGLNNFRVGFGKYAHSNYFELLATTGFLGVTLYLLIYAFMFHRAIRCRVLDDRARMIVRVFSIGVFTLVIMDIAHVSYFLKPYWLFMALGIMSLDMLRRPEIPQQSRDDSAPERFGHGQFA